MHPAKFIRLNRMIHASTNRSLMVPMDHGFTLGPIEGIETLDQVSQWVTLPMIQSVILHKGIYQILCERGVALRSPIIHLNGRNSLSSSVDDKILMTTLQAASLLGADAISLQLNFTEENDGENWHLLGRVTDAALPLGLPVLLMLYDKVPAQSTGHAIKRMQVLLRAATELGVDFIKVGIPSPFEALEEVLRFASQETRILVAGGTLQNEKAFLTQIKKALEWGARGVCVGRNVFSCSHPGGMLRELAALLESDPKRGTKTC